MTRPRRPNTTPAQMAKLRRLWMNDVPATEIAAALDMSTSHVYTLRMRMGLPVRCSHRPQNVDPGAKPWTFSARKITPWPEDMRFEDHPDADRDRGGKRYRHVVNGTMPGGQSSMGGEQV